MGKGQKMYLTPASHTLVALKIQGQTGSKAGKSHTLLLRLESRQNG